MNELNAMNLDNPDFIDVISLVKDHPGLLAYKHTLAVTKGNLALLLKDEGRLEEAERLMREVVAMNKAILEESPDYPEYRQSLARSYYNFANIFDDTGNLAKAEENFRNSIRLLQGLVEEFPDVPRHVDRLARAYHNLGDTLLDHDRPREAMRELQVAVRLKGELVSGHKGNLRYRDSLARSQGRLGDARTALNSNGHANQIASRKSNSQTIPAANETGPIDEQRQRVDTRERSDVGVVNLTLVPVKKGLLDSVNGDISKLSKVEPSIAKFKEQSGKANSNS